MDASWNSRRVSVFDMGIRSSVSLAGLRWGCRAEEVMEL